MGNLRPIGSEKLQGMDKINRIMEIARYKENRPNPINEDKSTEFSKKLSDGKTYRIDKEKNGYVIKRTINESTETFDYLEPMKNRKYYSSYSQAFKRLNLVVKEVNMSQGHQRNVSLFTESELDKELEEKRYYLNLGKKTEEKEQAPVAAAPAPAPAPVAAPAPAPTEEPSADLSGLDDMDLGAEVDTEEEDGDVEEKVTLKVIQKLTGKLAQKIRAFGGEEEDEELSSKDMKYVINSILSALDLDSLDEEDREEIMDKIEGVEEDEFGGSDEEGMGDEEEMGDEESVEPEAEMAEGFDDESMRNHFDDFDPKKFKKFPKNLDHSNLEKDSWSMDKFRKEFDKDEDDYENDYEDLYEEDEDDEISRDAIDSIFDEVTENEIDAPERVKTPERTRERETEREIERERRRKDRDDPFRPGKRPEERPAPRAGLDGPRKHRISHPHIDSEDASRLEDMLEGMFTESKVDSVLKKYFKLEEKEKNVLKEQKENSSKVRNSSVNVVQEMVSMKIMKKYPTAKFLGRTKNNNLVFEHKNKQFRITPKGGIL